MTETKSNFVVIDSQTKKEVNFYSTKLPHAQHYAFQCKRDMKALSGRDHEVLVKVEGQSYYISIDEYYGTINAKTKS